MESDGKRERQECSNEEEEDVAHNSNSNSNSNNNNNNMDPFLASMTFAGTGPDRARGGCDCEECLGPTSGTPLPQTIVDAIRRHKRAKAESGPMKRMQRRELVRRCGLISVYRQTMPLDSEPLLEFGTTHRLVWIRQLCGDSKLCSIGRGIVGSQDEEKDRQELTEWTHDGVFFVPSNGGKAVAWIHGHGKESKPSIGHAILYMCKIPPECMYDNESLDCEASKGWREIVLETCKNSIKNFENQNTTNQEGMQYQRVSEEGAGRLRQVLSEL